MTMHRIVQPLRMVRNCMVKTPMSGNSGILPLSMGAFTRMKGTYVWEEPLSFPLDSLRIGRKTQAVYCPSTCCPFQIAKNDPEQKCETSSRKDVVLSPERCPP